MAEMSHRARLWCQSPPWRAFAGRIVLPWALQGLDLHGDVLEIGCGSGAMASGMLRRNPAVRLTATDFDESMVEAARRRLAEFGARAQVRQADATTLPFPDGSFDRVVTFVMLHHVIAWETALAEAARVLRRGGMLIGYDLMGDGGGGIMNGREHGTRRMHLAELREHLGRPPYVGANVQPGLGGRVVRFRASRSPA